MGGRVGARKRERDKRKEEEEEEELRGKSVGGNGRRDDECRSQVLHRH